MQWTIGKKLYTCIGAVGVATAAMIGGGGYVQREISADLEQLATRTAPAMQDAEELMYLAERVGSTLRDGVVAAARQDRSAIDRDVAAVAELEGEFRRRVAELGAETDVAEVKALADECERIISDVRAKSGELASLLREFKVQEASARLVDLETLVGNCRTAATKIAELQASQLKVATEEARTDERLGMTVLIGMGVAALSLIHI